MVASPALLSLRASMRHKHKIKVRRREEDRTQALGHVFLQLSFCNSPPCTGLTVPGHRRFLFLCLVRLVSTAPRVEEPEKTPRRHQRGQHPAGSGRAARAGDHDTGVPSAQHGFLMPAAGTFIV